MASPFSFFRRNQQSMMVALVILAMLVFTLDDLFRDGGRQLTLLGAIIGGAIFCVAGIGKGKWVQYGAIGAVVGGVFSFGMQTYMDSKATDAIRSSIGVFDNEKITQLATRRQIANQFISGAIYEANSRRPLPDAQIRMNRYMFGFMPDGQNDLIFTELLKAEGDELNIVVTNSMVSDYVNMATDSSVSSESLAKVRGRLRNGQTTVTEDELLGILRDELKARMAFQLLYPEQRTIPGAPDLFYTLFRRLNVSEQINVAAVPVEAFLDQIPEPSDAEISELFDKCRDKFPGADGPGTPGFHQLNEVKMAWLEIDYKEVEATIPAITDEDISKYYEENKDSRFRDRRPTTPAVPEIPNIPGVTLPAEGTPAEGTPAEGTPAEGTPAEGTPAEGTPAEGTPAEGTPAEGTPAEGTPAEGTPAEGTPAEGTPADGTPADGTPAEGTPAEGTPADGTPAEGTPAEGSGNDCFPFSDETPAATPAETQTPEQGVTNPSAQENPAAQNSEATATDPPAETPAQTTSGDAVPAAETVPSAAGTAPTEQATTDTPPAAPTTADGQAPDFTDTGVQYRPLDDELKAQIRDDLMRSRTMEIINTRMSTIVERMQAITAKRDTEKFRYLEEHPKAVREDTEKFIAEHTAEYLKEMEALAGEFEARFKSTGWVNSIDLMNDEEYPIGGSSTPPTMQDFMNPNRPNAVQLIFGGQFNSTQLFRPLHTLLISDDLDGGQTHWAWWTTDMREHRIPELSDEGIRDQVVKALKRQKARDLARARAEELATLVRTGLARAEGERVPMATSLETQTVTGKEGSAPLSVRQSGRFSWLERQFDFTNFRGAPSTISVSQITFQGENQKPLRYAGSDFMRTVFEELGDGEVGAVPNADFSVWHVVQVVDRTPAGEDGEAVLRTQMMDQGRNLQMTSSDITRLLNDEVMLPVATEWQKKLFRKYEILDDETGT